jgi:hypothetical protein
MGQNYDRWIGLEFHKLEVYLYHLGYHMELVKVEYHESSLDQMVAHMEKEKEKESLVADTDYLGLVDLVGNLEGLVDLVGNLEDLVGNLEDLVGNLEGVLGEIGASQPTGALFRTCWGGRRRE